MSAPEINVLVSMGTDRWTVFSAVVVYLFLRFLTRATEATGSAVLKKVWLRILPIAPEFVAVPMALLGWVPVAAGQDPLMRVAVGLWVAYVAGKAHKLLGQTVLGDDDRLGAGRGPPGESTSCRSSGGGSP